MQTKIHPYLIARLIAVQEAFNHPGCRPAVARTKAAKGTPRQGNNWKDILKEDDEQGGGGGGTARGHRGKNAVNAAKALRKLTRSR